MNPNCTIRSFKKLLRQILQLCSIADLPWWLCFSWLSLPNYCSLKSYDIVIFIVIVIVIVINNPIPTVRQLYVQFFQLLLYIVIISMA